MHTEVTTMFPVPLKEGFAYLQDFRCWPLWYVGLTDILHLQDASWDKPGDSVQFAYKLLGRRLEGEAVLEEIRDLELVRSVSSIPRVLVVRQTVRFAEAGDSDFALKVEMDTSEATRFFGKLIDRRILPRALARDLHASLSNLNDVFASGLHE